MNLFLAILLAVICSIALLAMIYASLHRCPLCGGFCLDDEQECAQRRREKGLL